MSSRTPTNEDERTAVLALQHVGMPPASWDKRFRNQLSELALSEKERPQVWRMFVRYRRQIHGQVINGVSLRGAPLQNLLALAEKLAAPDFRKQQAAAAAQARIDELRRKQAAEGRLVSSSPRV